MEDMVMHIDKEFKSCDTIIFVARRFNCLKYRKIILINSKLEFNADMFFSMVGITPKMLYPVFGGKSVEHYDDLGCIPSTRYAFKKFAEIIQKDIIVVSKDIDMNRYYRVFVACKDGSVKDYYPCIDCNCNEFYYNSTFKICKRCGKYDYRVIEEVL